MVVAAVAPVRPEPASADLAATVEEEAPVLPVLVAVRGQASALLVQSAVEEDAPVLLVRAAVRELVSASAAHLPVAPAWAFPRSAVPVDAVPARPGVAAGSPAPSPASSLERAVVVPGAWAVRT